MIWVVEHLASYGGVGNARILLCGDIPVREGDSWGVRLGGPCSPGEGVEGRNGHLLTHARWSAACSQCENSSYAERGQHFPAFTFMIFTPCFSQGLANYSKVCWLFLERCTESKNLKSLEHWRWILRSAAFPGMSLCLLWLCSLLATEPWSPVFLSTKWEQGFFPPAIKGL